MIIGDKIATSNVMLDNVPQIVEVIAIENGEIVWSYEDGEARGQRYVAHAWINTWQDLSTGKFAFYAVGRVRKRDRGITWAPAWIEREVELLSVVAALGRETT